MVLKHIKTTSLFFFTNLFYYFETREKEFFKHVIGIVKVIVSLVKHQFYVNQIFVNLFFIFHIVFSIIIQNIYQMSLEHFQIWFLESGMNGGKQRKLSAH